MIGQMAIAIALRGLNDLRRLVTFTFLFLPETAVFFPIISTLSKNGHKNQCGRSNQDFCTRRDIKSFLLEAARRVKLVVTKCELVFKEPRQLTESNLLQRSNSNNFWLTDTVALFDNEVRFFQI